MRTRALAALAAVAAAGCGPAPAPPPGAVPFAEIAAAVRIAGDWRWAHVSAEDGTRRREREHWLLVRDGLTRVRGSYLRDVEIELLTDDGAVFACNQRPSYRQEARFDVVGVVETDGMRLEEVGYQATPSPCDPGLRQLAGYHAHVDHTGRLVLIGERSVARLTVGDGSPPPPALPPPATVDGGWRWSATSWTGDGYVQREDEVWHLAVHGDEVRGSYVRTVALVDPDGADIPCAGADRYQYVDTYRVEGKVTADGWRLREAAVTPGRHPCLAGMPTRTVDEATAVLDGGFLVLTWRGPRRQVLERVVPSASPW